MPRSNLGASASATPMDAAIVSGIPVLDERASGNARSREFLRMHPSALTKYRCVMLLPAVFGGAAIMCARNAPVWDWGTHLLAAATAIACCLVVTRIPWLMVERYASLVLWVVATGAALVAVRGQLQGLAGFSNASVPLQLSTLVCPVAVLLSASLMTCKPHAVHLVLVVMQGSHVIRADAAQASALGVGTLALVLAIRQPFKFHWLGLHALFVCAAWLRHEPAPLRTFVGDIALHAFMLAPMVGVVALGSLALAVCSPLPLVISENRAFLGQIALSLYFATTVLVSMFGEFPVPWLGLSPGAIIGSCVALALLTTWMSSSIGARS